MKTSLLKALLLLMLLPTCASAFWGGTRGNQSTALDFSRKSDYTEASALAIKLGQKISGEISMASGSDNPQLIIPLLLCEPFIESFHELLSKTERAHFRATHVRYGTSGLIDELGYLLTKITDIKAQMPEREREILSEIQNQQYALQQYPGIQNPNPNTAALIKAAPWILGTGGAVSLLGLLIMAIRGNAKTGWADTAADVNTKFATLDGKATGYYTTLTGRYDAVGATQESQNVKITKLEELLRLALSTLKTSHDDNKTLLNVIKGLGVNVENLKNALPMGGGGILGLGRKRTSSRNLLDRNAIEAANQVRADEGVLAALNELGASEVDDDTPPSTPPMTRGNSAASSGSAVAPLLRQGTGDSTGNTRRGSVIGRALSSLLSPRPSRNPSGSSEHTSGQASDVD